MDNKIDGLKTKMNVDYKIEPVKTSKDSIKHNGRCFTSLVLFDDFGGQVGER